MAFEWFKEKLSPDEPAHGAQKESRVEKGLGLIQKDQPKAAYLLQQLSTATDHRKIRHYMERAAELEAEWPTASESRAVWRLGWIDSAISGITGFLQDKFGLSESAATDLFWESGREWEEAGTTALLQTDQGLSEEAAVDAHREQATQWGEKGWIPAYSVLALADDPMDTVDALTVIFMQTFFYVEDGGD